MAQTQIGIQLYTLRDYTKTPEDIAKTLAKVKEIGYDAVQLSALGPIENSELVKLLRKNELAVAATHTSWDRLTGEIEAVIEEHKELGCKHVAIGSMPMRPGNYEDIYHFARIAEQVGQALVEAGLTFSYHNHSFEFAHFDGGTGLDVIADITNPKYLCFEIDTYWVQHGGGDPAEWIRKFKNRIHVIHFKDMVIADGKQAMCEVGEGNLNWPEIIEACKEADVEWYLVEQDTCAGDPFESIATSLKNMHKMGLQ